jgi:hypothetical protein
MIKWVNKKIATLALALSSVEKNALSQNGEALSTDVTQTRRLTQGQLCDSLINGEVTEEVLNLKWRTYKILKASEGVTAKITGYDSDGMPIVDVTRKDNKKALKKVKIDTHDNYPIEMVIDNTEIYLSGDESIDYTEIELLEKPSVNKDDNGNIISATHGSINGDKYFSTHKTERPIVIKRSEQQKFNIENFTKKLNVRTINDSTKLLEFYISIYPNEDNRSSRLLISEIKKILENKKTSSMLDINKVSFLTYKSLGVPDFLFYEYDVERFDKIIEYEGYYVLKFIVNVNINGEDILEKHKINSLDKKYETKEKK